MYTFIFLHQFFSCILHTSSSVTLTELFLRHFQRKRDVESYTNLFYCLFFRFSRHSCDDIHWFCISNDLSQKVWVQYVFIQFVSGGASYTMGISGKRHISTWRWSDSVSIQFCLIFSLHVIKAHTNSSNILYFRISLTRIIEADISAAVVLISMGALLGRTTPIQLLVMALIEVIVYAANEYFQLELLKVFCIVHWFCVRINGIASNNYCVVTAATISTFVSLMQMWHGICTLCICESAIDI